MKLGTVFVNSKLYDLDYMKSIELEKILNDNKNVKNLEFNKAKELYNKEEFEKIGKISTEFKQFVDNATSTVKLEAVILRAYIERTSNDAIANKVNEKRNAIFAEIKGINSKYTKILNKYSEIKDAITESINNYEKVLYDISKFYDAKIEQLILQKVELEAHLVGKIVREEFLNLEENKKSEAKENDKLLKSLSLSIKNAISKLKLKKEEKVIDVTMLSKLQDREDLENEQKENLNQSVENTKSNKKTNLEEISKLEENIIVLEKEIQRLNENKVKTINLAMENVGELQLTNSTKSIVSRIKNFFASRFNFSKVVFTNVINPFNSKIEEYRENELISIEEG